MKWQNLAFFFLTIVSMSFVSLNMTSATETSQAPDAETAKQLAVLNQILENKNLTLVIHQSRINRSKNRHSALIGIGTHSSIPSYSLRFDRYKDTDIAYGLQFYRSIEDTGDSREFGYAEKLTSIGGTLRAFTGNSFYLSAGLFYRVNEYQRDAYIRTYDFVDIQNIEASNDTYKDIALGFAIGNQWQWESFTLGVDWVGVTGSAIILDNGNIENRKQTVYFNRDTARVGLTLLGFNLGISF